MTDPIHVCSRCPAALGSSCCEVAPDEQLATLTEVDIRRIEEATGRKRARFVDSEWLSADEARDYENRRPLYRGHFSLSFERQHLRAVKGACVFLGEQGCTLTEESRPTACRLYPFERWPDGSWSLQVDRFGSVEGARRPGGGCLAVEEASEMEQVLVAFGFTHEGVEALGARLADEVAQSVRLRRRG